VAVKCPKCHPENPETKQFCADCGTQLPPLTDHSAVMTETLQTPVRALSTGSTFAGRYQIIEELGKGGWDGVYKVFDETIKEKVASSSSSPRSRRTNSHRALLERTEACPQDLPPPRLPDVRPVESRAPSRWRKFHFLDGPSLNISLQGWYI